MAKTTATAADKADERHHGLRVAVWPAVIAAVATIAGTGLGAAWKNYAAEQNRLDAEKKLDFGRQLRLCWLHCPDSVIRAANAFIDSTEVGAQCGGKKCTPADVTPRAQALLVSIRAQLVSESKLQDGDVRFLLPIVSKDQPTP